MPDTLALANTRPSEVRLSPDGSRLYSADADGFVRVYDMHTGGLINSWDVGQNLGGMDISPDGSFLVVVERNLTTTYKVDTATGAATSYLYATGFGEGLMFDVAVLSDGTALFSQNYNGSGWTTLKVLNFGTGVYTPGPSVRQSSVLSRSETGAQVLIGEPNISSGDIDIYQTGSGIVAHAGANGFNWGIQAFSGSLSAQYIYNEGIHIYNASLQRQVTLTAWNNGKVSDLAFSDDGAWLYILENVNNSIIKVSTADWDVEETIPVAADVGVWHGQLGATNGARLILDPQERYFSVVTDGSLVAVENPDAPPINGTNAADMLEGALFADRIYGFDGDDTLSGYAGNDQLDGGSGADTLIGGTGNDVFLVDQGGDRLVENVGGGLDLVYAAASYTLAAGSEIEILSTISQSATTAINLVGNAFGQQIYGNAGDNFLAGGGGTDYLVGLGGNDTYFVTGPGDNVVESAGGGTRDAIYTPNDYTMIAGVEVEVLSSSNQAGTGVQTLIGNAFSQEIYGNAGANFLQGGGGTDYLVGLGGNDVYFVTGAGDNVVESAGGGTDIIYTPLDYVMIGGVEVELLASSNQAGTNAQTLIGNGFSQTIYGNAGANFIDGGGGTDTLVGLGGNDTYLVDSLGDYVAESVGGGQDVVYAQSSYALYAGQEIEVLSAASLAGTGAIDLTGNELANQLYGNAGANMLNGGAGADFLQGFGGADIFAFTSALGNGNVDAIADFVSGTDKIALDDAVFGVFTANAFATGSQAQDADDRIVYNNATGQLFFDADGNGAGAAVLFATLDGHPPLTASDFVVI